MFLALNQNEWFTSGMKKFITNHGHELESETPSEAFEKAIKNQIAITSEIVGCPLKLHFKEFFEIAARKVDGVVLILVPDLPDFVANAIQNLPQIRVPFAISAGQPKGDRFEIENLSLGSQPFIYSGSSWNEVSMRHAYFQAACRLIQDNQELNAEALFITCDSISDEEDENLIRRGLVMHEGGSQGSSDVRGVKLP